VIDFEREVLQRSHEVPVVVDFWADWCEPCRILGPIIEALAARAAGKWELVQLDTEEQPEVAAAWGIQGIPAVKLFHRGEVVGEFVGVRPAPEIARWLATHLPDPRSSELVRILDETETDRPDRVRRLEEFRGRHPDMPLAALRLAQAVLLEDPPRARILSGEAGATAELQEASADVAALADLLAHPPAPQALADHLDAAGRALRAEKLDRTLDHLLEAAKLDRHFGEDLARRASVALFHRLGPDHELTREHQRRLGMILNP